MGVVQWKVYDQQSNDTMVVTDMCTVPVTTISLNLQSLFVGAVISQSFLDDCMLNIKLDGLRLFLTEVNTHFLWHTEQGGVN